MEQFLILIVKKKILSTLFCTFALTFVSLSRHFRKRRALLILAFIIKFSQNLNAQKGWDCNNAHATDIYYPERDNYILALRGWLLLILLCGQCEKPDGRVSKIQSSRFLHIYFNSLKGIRDMKGKKNENKKVFKSLNVLAYFNPKHYIYSM